MTSAPSDANLTACARPCPRAAPVMKATLPPSVPIVVSIFVSSRDRSSAAQLTLGGVTGDDGLHHLDVGRSVEVFADGAEQGADRGGGAVGLQRILVGPLLDEDERAIGLVQGVELTAGLAVDGFDGGGAGRAHGVNGF